MAALITDALRADWLETMGYSVQVMEFIDTAHTPKNLLIRAVRTGRPAGLHSSAEYVAFRDYWNVNPHIGQANFVKSTATDTVSLLKLSGL